MRCFVAIFVSTLLAVAVVAEDRVTLENDFGPRSSTGEWTAVRRATKRDRISLRVVFKKSAEALDLLERRFWEVSDPRHSDYGRFLSKDEVTNIVKVSPTTIAAVQQWLQQVAQEDISFSVGANKDTMTIAMAATDANVAFGTDMHVYQHNIAQDFIVRAASPYSIPSQFSDKIEVVGNLLQFPAVWTLLSESGPSTKKATSIHPVGDAWPDDCGKCSSGLFGKRVTPDVLTSRYHLGAAPNGTTVGSIAVAEFTQVYWDQQDLDLYAADCHLKNFSIIMHGSNKPKQCFVSIIIRPNLCKEALLDIETIKGVVGTIPLHNFYTDQYSILDWAENLSALEEEDLPMVQSVSYGNDEAQQSSVAYMDSVNVEFKKLGLRGVSILFASGDGGVYGRDGSGKRFHPGFPATSPYATSVGGTNFVHPGTIGDETAWGGSGGGFSDTFGVPEYQSEAVKTYKTEAASTLPDASKWNQTGRGFPDVAALGGQHNPYCITLAKGATGAYGTSAATPTVASIVAKLNEIRYKKKKSPMGFLNPFLYQNANVFNDVTTGNNGGPQGQKGGFYATKGWDPLTGLGTPDFEKLAQLV